MAKMEILKKKPRLIYAVDAREFPNEIENWCCEHDYSTHYDNSIIQLWKDTEEDNLFIEWFEKEYDVKIDRTVITHIAVFAT